MLGGFTRSLSALVHFTLHTGAGVDSVVYTAIKLNEPLDFEREGDFLSRIVLHAMTRNQR